MSRYRYAVVAAWFAALIIPSPVVAGMAAGKVYWTEFNSGTIRRANLDGSNVENVIMGLDAPLALTIDPEGSMIYWAEANDQSGGPGIIRRAHLDGTGIEDLYEGTRVYDIELDAASGLMYWVDDRATASLPNQIRRGSMNGGTSDTLRTMEFMHALALDLTSDQMYFSRSNQIWRCDLNGSNGQTLLPDLGLPYDVDVDPDAGLLYWTDEGTDKIQRANIDGTGIEDLVTEGLSQTHGIALDVIVGKIYWAETVYDRVQRANLDGSNVEDVLTGLNAPFQVAVVPIPEPSTGLILIIGSRVLSHRRKRWRV